MEDVHGALTSYISWTSGEVVDNWVVRYVGHAGLLAESIEIFAQESQVEGNKG